MKRAWAASALATVLLATALGVDTREYERKPEPLWVDLDVVEEAWHAPGAAYWTHWWEYNRMEFLHPPEASAPVANQVPPQVRQAAIDALKSASSSPRGNLPVRGETPYLPRAYAAVSLARMREASAAARLIEMTEDPQPPVRRAAWVSLGWLGTAEARRHLFTPQDSGPAELGRVMGIGLLPDLSAQELERLIALFRETRHKEVRRMAAWAMRVHESEEVAELMRQTLDQTDDPFLAAEAILALGRVGTPEDELVLGFGVYGSTHRHTYERLRPRVISDLHRYILNVDHDPRDGQVKLGYIGESMPLYAYDMLGLRAAAAIALGHRYHEHGYSVAESVLHEPFEDQTVELEKGWLTYWGGSDWGYPETIRRGKDDRWTSAESVERRLTLVSLGRLGNEEDLALLKRVVDLYYENPVIEPRDARLYSPLRGFALMGLGVYMHESNLAAQDPPQERVAAVRVGQRQREAARLARDLVKRLRQLKVRGEIFEPHPALPAVALALGMSGDPASAGDLAQVLPARDGLLTAYGCLALGMMGDGRAVEVAHGLLGVDVDPLDAEALYVRMTDDPPNESLDRGARLLARAAAMGVGLSGDRRGVPLLLSALGRDYYVDRAIIRALKWQGDLSLLPVLIRIAEAPQAVSDQQFALALWGVGELLDPDPLPRAEKRLQRDANMLLPLYRCQAQRIQVDRTTSGFTKYPVRLGPRVNGAYAMYGYLGNEFLYDAWIEGGRTATSALGQSYGLKRIEPEPK